MSLNIRRVPSNLEVCFFAVFLCNWNMTPRLVNKIEFLRTCKCWWRASELRTLPESILTMLKTCTKRATVCSASVSSDPVARPVDLEVSGRIGKGTKPPNGIGKRMDHIRAVVSPWKIKFTPRFSPFRSVWSLVASALYSPRKPDTCEGALIR